MISAAAVTARVAFGQVGLAVVRAPSAVYRALLMAPLLIVW